MPSVVSPGIEPARRRSNRWLEHGNEEAHERDREIQCGIGSPPSLGAVPKMDGIPVDPGGKRRKRYSTEEGWNGEYDRRQREHVGEGNDDDTRKCAPKGSGDDDPPAVPAGREIDSLVATVQIEQADGGRGDEKRAKGVSETVRGPQPPLSKLPCVEKHADRDADPNRQPADACDREKQPADERIGMVLEQANDANPNDGWERK